MPSLIPNGRNEPQIPFSTSPFASTGVLHLSSRGRSSIVRRAAPCTCRNQPVRSIRVILNSIAGGLVGHRPAGATHVHALDVEHCDVGLSPLAPVSCQLPIRGRPRPPSAAAAVRPTLASLTMPSSSSTTAEQAPSQRGVETGIAALEPCPYVGRERNPADRPAISAACHDPRLGEGWRWPGHLIQVVTDPPETAAPPGRRDLYVGVLRSAWSIRRKRKPLRHLPRPSLMVQEIQGPIRPRRDGCFVQFTVCFRCQPSADGMTSGQAQEGAQR